MSRKNLLYIIFALYIGSSAIYSIFFHELSTELIFSYASFSASILIGFWVAKKSNINLIKISKRKSHILINIIRFIILFQILALGLALPFMIQNPDGYRNLYFIEQGRIFGIDNFGIIFNIISEYLFVAIISILLTNSEIKRSVVVNYIITWAILGTILTFGRWYILYGLILIICSKSTLKVNKIKLFIYFILIIILFWTIYSCRSFECNINDLFSINDLFLGLSKYFIIPVGMFEHYKESNIFNFNLNLGYVFYPIYRVYKIFNAEKLVDFQYDYFALEIQENIDLDGVGIYNALVGQITASYLGFKYIGIFFNYLPFGYLLNLKCDDDPSKLNQFNLISFIIIIFGFFIPSISGPMAFFELIFIVIASNFSLSRYKYG